MSIVDALRQLESEIAAYAKLYTPARGRKFKEEIKKSLNENAIQISLANAAISAIELRVREIQQQENLTKRFETISRRFPFPNAGDTLDKLIYGRFTLGYAVMNDGRKAQRTATGVANASGPNKYVSYALSKAQLGDLNGDNFKILCELGFPKATHEYLYTHELRNQISNASVITECERLLAQYGY